MTKKALSYLNGCFEQLQIPYEFMGWTSELSFPYFIGEYSETESMSEDGLEEGTFILTGTTTNNFLELEEVKEKVKNFFTSEGKTAILDNNSGIAVSYANAMPVDTGESGLHRLQINLNVKEWKGE